MTDYMKVQESADPVMRIRPACAGKDFEHHERTEIEGDLRYGWRCPDCGDSGTFDALFKGLLELQPLFYAVQKHVPGSYMAFLVPSDATPRHLGQCFGRPVFRVRGIDRPMIALGMTR